MDSPGLLDRPETERNEMEKLTYASLAVIITFFSYFLLNYFILNYFSLLLF